MKRNEWILLLAGASGLLVLLIFLFGTTVLHPIGGPVPVEIRLQNYLHPDDAIFDTGFKRTVYRREGSVMYGKPPIFPDLSPATGSVFHTREGSNDLYLTVVWYFTDRDKYQNKRGVLDTFYLARYGNLSAARLTFDYDKTNRTGTPEPRTMSIDVNGFENNLTAGYFMTISYPESRKPDFFIVYYGAVKSGNLSRQAPYLQQFMKPFFDPAQVTRTVMPVRELKVESDTNVNPS